MMMMMIMRRRRRRRRLNCISSTIIFMLEVIHAPLK
jgi:hypothetical protein